jgi:hypothetical protein
MKIIKSNTWIPDYPVVVKRKANRPHKLILSRKRPFSLLINLTGLLLFIALVWIPILGWIACYYVYKWMLMYGKDTLLIEDIQGIEVITSENEKSMASKIGWGLAGGTLLGGVGLLAGVLAKGERNKTATFIQFTKDRNALVLGDAKDINELTMLSFQGGAA